MSNTQDPLFQPYVLGELELPNRIVMPPMTRSRASQPGDVPNALMAAYYAQRASAGLIVSEGTWIAPLGKGYAWTPGIHSPAQVEGWRQGDRSRARRRRADLRPALARRPAQPYQPARRAIAGVVLGHPGRRRQRVRGRARREARLRPGLDAACAGHRGNPRHRRRVPPGGAPCDGRRLRRRRAARGQRLPGQPVHRLQRQRPHRCLRRLAGEPAALPGRSGHGAGRRHRGQAPRRHPPGPADHAQRLLGRAAAGHLPGRGQAAGQDRRGLPPYRRGRLGRCAAYAARVQAAAARGLPRCAHLRGQTPPSVRAPRWRKVGPT